MNKITITQATIRIRQQDRVFTFILNDGVELTFNGNGTVDFHFDGVTVPDVTHFKELLETGVDTLEISQREDKFGDQVHARIERKDVE